MNDFANTNSSNCAFLQRAAPPEPRRMHEVTGLTPRSGRRLPGTWGGVTPPSGSSRRLGAGGGLPPAVTGAVPLTPVYPPPSPPPH